ncbi:MAG: LPS export ABC transporter periplasmic protein LptC [Salinimicrobium sediminis]|uniref:LPS export ABC transporter protein LptC n=1 Tax=Salinimicrobium sediminis TaxID=1343891 RepID=A0A285X3P9_9FLAO|nr:LPS export ABC transporter periplasmic protein LptC [Salinimicrobium sediminis]MDX1603421.1 LPS export ABC transporter periplasmic protein LptC [Salinimicrobium sediminis]SOC79973.1 LPS export ABC transporter protein LptC [Salinimicrobium sediminis]
MKITYRNSFTGIVTILFVTMLFSCEGNLKGVRQMEMPEDAPQAIGQGINLKYTDSGRVVATLKSEKMKDYSNKNFPYREFPEGLMVEFYDEERKKNTVTANYGVIYNETGLIDLQGNVVVITSDSTELTADQLYWDQTNNWVFTDHPNTIKFKNGARNKGQGFDSNQEFTNFRSRSNVGVQILEEETP